MNKVSNYNKNIGFIRMLSCIAVLLYHMNILKGGYLAVCVFFAMSGYLSCVSLFKKEKVSLGKYYLNRVIKIYLPLIIVTFLSVLGISMFSQINWFNLKPETTSVLLGYNNYWQLNANLDYFARHVDSPFMHFWYIAIILQFDLVFPIIFKVLKKIGDKVHKSIPCILTIILAIVSAGYFYYSSVTSEIMLVYYDTFNRVFSLLFGVALGFMHSYYKVLIPKFLKNKFVSRFIFFVYILIIVALNIMIAADSPYFAYAIILVTLITCRLIDYSYVIETKRLNILDRIIKSISDVSYEIYLVQYPIIYIFQFLEMNIALEYTIIVSLTILISYIIHFSLNYKYPKLKIFRYIIFILVILLTSIGGYKYFISKDHTEEMKELELNLAENTQKMQEQQALYIEQAKKAEENWLETLEGLENGEKELRNVVSNLRVVGVGDSVMLGAVYSLQAKFPNGYFDAETSRTAWVVSGILQSLSNSGALGEPIILNLGANGDCPEIYKHQIMNVANGRKVFWINITNGSHINASIEKLAENYDNLYIIDWYNISKNHPEYFYADGIHLTKIGVEVYTETIYNAIYQVYLAEYNEKKDKIIESYEKIKNNKMSFYGNGILLNCYEYLQEDFSDVEFIAKNEYTFEDLKKEVITRKENNNLTKKVLFAFDSNLKLTNDNYLELIKICSDNEIYILALDKKLKELEKENVYIIDYYKEIEENKDYLLADKIHLSNKGNSALKDKLKSILKNNTVN